MPHISGRRYSPSNAARNMVTHWRCPVRSFGCSRSEPDGQQDGVLADVAQVEVPETAVTADRDRWMQVLLNGPTGLAVYSGLKVLRRLVTRKKVKIAARRMVIRLIRVAGSWAANYSTNLWTLHSRGSSQDRAQVDDAVSQCHGRVLSLMSVAGGGSRNTMGYDSRCRTPTASASRQRLHAASSSLWCVVGHPGL